ncbi:MAG: phage virion morphogenesis protein [Candidatus Accumulibacter sp.]|jgi:phage virion morphogenesis protein|nr:phage virion morphogenesis protein [Accumulibacter sp.]
MTVDLMHITVDSSRVKTALDNLESAAHDLSPVMSDIAATLWERVGERFETRHDPVGDLWEDKKSGEPSALYEHGDLIDSLSRRSNATHAMVGFGQPYAAYHEFGTVKMFRRGLLFADPESGALSPDDEEAILDRVHEHLLHAIER